MQVVVEPASVSCRGGSVSFKDEFSRCQSCNHEFYSLEQSILQSQLIASAKRGDKYRFTPSVIKEMRKKFQLTQAQFEQALGVGPKTVVRWELGTVVPNQAVESLLWIAQNFPVVFAKLAERNGIDLSPYIATHGQRARVPAKATTQQVARTARSGGLTLKVPEAAASPYNTKVSFTSEGLSGTVS